MKRKILCTAILVGACAIATAQDAVKHKDTGTGSSTAKNINTSEDNLGSGKGNTTVHGATGSTGTTSAAPTNDTLGGRGAVANGASGLAVQGKTPTTPPAGNVKPATEHASALANGK